MLSFRIFKALSILNRKSWGAVILRECSPPTMCHMSHVMCQVSGVRCQVSHFFIFFFFNKVVELVGGFSVIKGAYPVYFFIFFYLQTSFFIFANIYFGLSAIVYTLTRVEVCFSFSAPKYGFEQWPFQVFFRPLEKYIFVNKNIFSYFFIFYISLENGKKCCKIGLE